MTLSLNNKNSISLCVMVPWQCYVFGPLWCPINDAGDTLGSEAIQAGEHIVFGDKNNPFKCHFKNNFSSLHNLKTPGQEDCSTIAYLATFALVVTGCVVAIMLCMIGLELGFAVDVLDSVLEVALLLMEYISTGLEWLLGLWEWAYWMVTYTSTIVAEGTGVNPILVWLLGVEGLVAGTLVLIHNSLRLYWTFHESAAYPLFFWLNTPIRYIVTEWLTPNLGFFLTAIIEMLVFFPLEIPILAVALVYGGLKKAYAWVKGEWLPGRSNFMKLHDPTSGSL